MKFQRTSTILRAADDEAGTISGILVTDGEASDGHILNIDGGQFPEQAPLLFGHDDYTGKGNLGSWSEFRKVDLSKKGRGIRGTAQIELGGTGAQAEWRADVDHMIQRGHIGQFSVRWDEVSEPVRRVNLPSDHPAYVNAEKAKGRKAWGYYFDKWRLLEGSVVTLGADPAALIGRMQESDGDVRQFWRSAVNQALEETYEPAPGIVAIDTSGGLVYIERAAYDAILETANERLQIALDLSEEMVERSLQYAIGAEPVPDREESAGEEEAPEAEAPAGSSRSVLSFDAREVEFPANVEEIVRAFANALEESEARLQAGVGALMRSLTGKES